MDVSIAIPCRNDPGIFATLASIDEKVDDVLRKVDDTMVAQLLGMSEAVERAMTLRDAGGSVDETTWSTVDQAPATIGATQSYALDQIKAVAERLENTRLRDLAKAAEQADPDVRKGGGQHRAAAAGRRA